MFQSRGFRAFCHQRQSPRVAFVADVRVNAEVNIIELKREKLTIAVQNGLDMGWSLKETLDYLVFRGVQDEDIALVRREDLVFPTIGKSTSVAGSLVE